MNFRTPKFDTAVTEFKAHFGTHTQMYTRGQFYVTGKVVDGIIARLDWELRHNLGLMFAKPGELENLIAWFRRQLSRPITDVPVHTIVAMIDAIEVGSDMYPIRQLFTSDRNDAVNARKEFDEIWGNTAIPSNPYWSGSPDTIGKAFAAYRLEQDRCFEVLRSMSRKLLATRPTPVKLPAAAYLSTGALAGAGKPVVVAAAAGDNAATQQIPYSLPAQLGPAYTAMRNTLDRGGFVHCGVLSGAAHDHSKFPQPEHHILVIAYDKVGGQDVFLFWDPDAGHSDIGRDPVHPEVATPWGPGFGVLFATAKRLSTAIDDADLTNIDRRTKIADVPNGTFGDHLDHPRRHCYQVYYVQSLPLAHVVKVHTKVLATPRRTSLDDMWRRATDLYAAHNVELVEASREDLVADAGELNRFRMVCTAASRPTDDLTDLHETFRSPDYPPGPQPASTDVLVVVVDALVPAATATIGHPEAKPGTVLSAAQANDWTLAHQLGHLLGLAESADPANLMFTTTDGFGDNPPQLDDADIATITSSPLAQG